MYKKYIKRILDFLCSIIALPFWLIIFLIVTPFIYFEDRGPIFYNAPRLGKDGKIFTMFKFRSMKVNAQDIRNEDGSTYNAADDPRLTRIGKFLRKTSIDETPQLLNVFKGEMSLVGPRPDLPEHRELYEGNEQRKLEVRPGISGYNQAYFRNQITWKKRIRNDIYYVDNLSFALDMKIIINTMKIIFKKEGVYIEEKIGELDD